MHWTHPCHCLHNVCTHNERTYCPAAYPRKHSLFRIKCLNFQLQIQFHYQSNVWRIRVCVCTMHYRCTKETYVYVYRDWKCGNSSPLQTFCHTYIYTHTHTRLCCCVSWYTWFCWLYEVVQPFLHCISQDIRAGTHGYINENAS